MAWVSIPDLIKILEPSGFTIEIVARPQTKDEAPYLIRIQDRKWILRVNEFGPDSRYVRSYAIFLFERLRRSGFISESLERSMKAKLES